jgi:hypothetical protein
VHTGALICGAARGNGQANHQWIFYPLHDGSAGAFGNLKPDRFLRFALKDGRSFLDLTGRHDIDDLHADKITAAQFAVDRHIKQGEVAMVFGQLKPHADRPDVFGFQRSLLTDDAALVPSGPKCANGR